MSYRRLQMIACSLLLSLMLGKASALDVVVVVANDSPVSSLSRHQLTDIYLGRVTQLPDGGRVTPIDQVERSPAHGAFYAEYLGQTPAQIRAHWSRLIFTGRGQPPRAVRNGQSVAEAVADNPSAIGYLDVNMVDERLRVVRIE